jgi:GNAT superfamily N-acetyltransferase
MSYRTNPSKHTGSEGLPHRSNEQTGVPVVLSSIDLAVVICSPMSRHRQPSLSEDVPLSSVGKTSGCVLESLSIVTLEQAIDVANKTFLPPQAEDPATGFRASLVQGRDPNRLRYWVAIDPNTGVVIGTTGLYKTPRDYDDAYWVGWMCVTPQRRGQGVGKDLLEFTIAMARSQGKRWLRLYTSTDPIEKVAQVLYERYGLREVCRIPSRHSRYPLIFREKAL